ncbi:DEAD/DEAH box helicase [bacterium]|nr:DEAD/DEAH box helicase [bacterium]
MKTFSEFNLPDDIQEVLQEKDFLEPTPVQKKVIPQILKSHQDIIAIAQTGTGKTAAFSLPVLSKMDPNDRSVQTVVLSPTRELAMQIAKDMKGFAKNIRGLNIVAVYGGSSIQDQIREIKRGAQVVVGTPGRMLDLLNRRVLKLGNVQWAILDEADEMLKMGFVEDISSILGNTPEGKQTLLFSATMSRTIEQIAKRYMHDSLRIEIKPADGRKLAIDHQYMMVPARNKVVALQRYKALHPEMYGIVFCRTKRETQEIGDALLKAGYPVGVLHGDIEQRHRTRIMDGFKRRDTSLLVATDVAARGIDVEKLTHVIHIGVPEKAESYTHRSGRTGRANEKGVSIVLAHLRERFALNRIEKINGIKFEEIKVPKREDLIQIDVEKYTNLLEDEPQVSILARQYVDKMLQDVSPEEMKTVARRALLLTVEDKISKHPEEEMDRSRVKGKFKRREKRMFTGNMKTLVISLGRKNSLTVPHLLGMINEVTRGERVDIGHIQLGDNRSSFEVPLAYAEKLRKAMSGQRFKGERVSVYEGEPVKRSGLSRGGKRNKGRRRVKKY